MSFQEKFLGLDGTNLGRIGFVVVVLAFCSFLVWSFHIRAVFEEGYYQGIKECFVSQEGFAEMFAYGKASYGNYFNLTTNLTQQLDFLENFNITKSLGKP